MATLNPTPEAVTGKVPELREKFKAKYAGEISKGVFDKRDVDRLLTDDGYARCFLRTMKSKGDVEKAVEVVNECFIFRKEIGIWDLTQDSFPKELVDRQALYYKGTTKDNFPVVYMKTKENTAKTDEDKVVLKKFIAYNFEQHHRKTPEQFVVALLDMTGTGVGSLQTDIMKYIIACFSIYFPAYLGYMINYDMPTLVSAAWKVVSAFLKEDQKGKIIMIGKKDIGKYLAPEHLWDHMK